MTRTQIQQLVVVLFLILFVGVFLISKKAPESGSVTPSPSGTPETAPHPAEPAAPASQVPAPDLSIPRDVFLLPALLLQRLQQRERENLELEQQKALEKNPKQEALSAEQAGITDLELQGIFWGVAKPQAIINRQIVSVGDRVDAAEVESITWDSVILWIDGKKIELKPETFRSSDNSKEGKPTRSRSSPMNLR